MGADDLPEWLSHLEAAMLTPEEEVRPGEKRQRRTQFQQLSDVGMQQALKKQLAEMKEGAERETGTRKRGRVLEKGKGGKREGKGGLLGGSEDEEEEGEEEQHEGKACVLCQCQEKGEGGAELVECIECGNPYHLGSCIPKSLVCEFCQIE